MIHPTAIVHPSAKIGRGAEIGPFCLVGPRVVIGARARLLAHVVVNGHTELGEDVEIHPFSVIGVESQDRKTSESEIARTVVGARTVIREYVKIDRATGHGEVTAVGEDCLLLAYAHVAHNCTVGNHVTMSNLAQLAGHAVVEDHAGIGGMAGVKQFTRVGRHAFVGGYTKLVRDLPPYCLADGNPAELRGLNLVGLRRAGVARETIRSLDAAFDALVDPARPLAEAVAALAAAASTDEERAFVAFLAAESKNGVMKNDARLREHG